MAAPAITTATPVNSGLSNSRMSSPKDSKKNLPTKSDDPQSVTQESNQADASQAANTTTEVKQETDGKPAASTAEGTSNAQPLAPPPRPNQNASGDTPDYFGGKHTSDHFQLEPNPFEQSFGTQPNAETPGKSLLPPVASLTSPSSLLPGGTPGWQNSLRSGPLSPAMLAGPASQTDYFDPSFRGGFPTPNESSLRTGLTPGGGGSMFPAPSPNSQALYNSLQSGGATPSTLDFHRTALSAAAQAKIQNNQNSNFAVTSAGPTSSAQEQAAPVASMAGGQQGQQQHQAQQQDPFGQHDANDAANGLFMLAQANGARNNQQQQHQNQQQQQGFAVPGQPAHNINTNMQHMQIQMGQQSQNTSPVNRRGNNSITSVSGSADTGEFSNSDDPSQKPNTRTRGKKGANGKAQNGNNRRKAEDTPVKAPASKKAKTSTEMPDFGDGFDDEDEDGDMDMKQETGPDGKKMTDEEKRKNFLERNRVAALKCRQRKKQWLANLQAKVELFSTENDALSAQVTQLREEIINLKTLLLAHKDCPVSQAQGLGGMAMNNLIGDINQHANPYGMAMQPNGVQMGMQMPQSHQQPLQQRRYDD